MGAIRTLYTDLKLRAADAVRGLKAYDALWKTVARSVEASATAVERAAARAEAAMSRVTVGAATVRAGAGAVGRGGTSASRRAADPLDAVIREARRTEREAQRRIAQDERITNRRAQAEARQGGLAAGSERVTQATRALGTFAKANERAKAKVADLEATIAKNRRELVALREQVAKGGDATGALKARMEGLSVATGRAAVDLSSARRELRALNGGFLEAVKKATLAKVSVVALGTAFGNMITGAVSGAFRAVVGGLTEAADKAIKFESAMADVRKVLPDDTTVAQFKGIEEGLVGITKRVAVAPTGIAELAAALAQSGIAREELVATAEDASKLAVAFGISGKEAGDAIAKMRTSMELGRDGVNALTGSINHLSNNMAATAPEILDVVKRVGSVGKAAQLSGEQVSALGAAMLAGGAEQEIAATGVKNFALALAAGETATKRQREAFHALGLDAKAVAVEFTSGDAARANAAMRDLIGRIGQLGDAERVATIKNLFGRESLGAIAPLATNVKLFDQAMGLALDTTKTLTSVQDEYNVRSKTTANAIQLLKNNIEALAIQFGNALLPHINKVVEFLTSPEGQEWGKSAVQAAVGAVTSLADAVKNLVSFFGHLAEKVGGVTVAVGALGLAFTALAGPWGLFIAGALAGAVALGNAMDNLLNGARNMRLALLQLRNEADAIRLREQGEEVKEAVGEADAGLADSARRKRIDDAVERWERQQRAKGVDTLEVTRRGAKHRLRLLTGQGGGRIGTFEERIGEFEASLGGGGGEGSGGEGSGGAGGDAARFQELVAAKKRRQLRPREAAELRALSISLDRAVPTRGRTHKATKMDRALAAIDPSLRGVLTQGGDADRGGDLKVADNPLDRAVYAAATRGAGGAGQGASLGPGPNITNTYNNFSVTVQQMIDASSQAPVSENVRAAARESGERVGGVVLRGLAEFRAAQNGGGRLA